MYTVKQVSEQIGIPGATLRAWETRYRVVTPSRSAGGYRLYDDAQVATLRRMAALVAGGQPASLAAAALSAVPAELPERADGALDLVSTAATLDAPTAHAVLAAGIGDVDPERDIASWLLPELVRVGDAWARGRLGVAQEHFITRVAQARLHHLFDETPAPARGRAPLVLLGLPGGCFHSAGLEAFAVLLRRRALDVVQLGADVPLESWQASVEQLQPRAVVTAATMTDDLVHVADLVNALPLVEVWLGGAAADPATGARLLPAGPVPAADELAATLLAGVRG